MKSVEKYSPIKQKTHHENQLKRAHLFMNKMYYALMFSEEPTSAYQKENLNKLRRIELAWMFDEKNTCLNQYDCDRKVTDVSIVESALKQHPVYQHPLFDYLHYEANRNDLKIFIRNESVLNLEFFDYLVLSIIGARDPVKSEIAVNLWDEAGQGNIQRFHTTLFKNMLQQMGVDYKRNHVIENMPWEGIAGINLFSYFSLYSFNKIKYFGLLAATEMLDPPHYHKLINGIKRIFDGEEIDHTYYTEHETIDIAHADGWLRKIIIPELILKPKKTQDFWLGFYMRLNSAKRYYDKVLDRFITRIAA